MSDGAVIRDLEPSDVEQVRQIHEDSQLDYRFPNIQSPLFLVKKSLSVDGKVRIALGGYIQLEAYLWLDQSDWADPEQKLIALQEVAKAAIEEAGGKGVEEVVIKLPPDMERFGRRLAEDFEFTEDRSGWRTFSKRI